MRAATTSLECIVGHTHTHTHTYPLPRLPRPREARTRDAKRGVDGGGAASSPEESLGQSPASMPVLGATERRAEATLRVAGGAAAVLVAAEWNHPATPALAPRTAMPLRVITVFMMEVDVAGFKRVPSVLKRLGGTASAHALAAAESASMCVCAAAYDPTRTTVTSATMGREASVRAAVAQLHTASCTQVLTQCATHAAPTKGARRYMCRGLHTAVRGTATASRVSKPSTVTATTGAWRHCVHTSGAAASTHAAAARMYT